MSDSPRPPPQSDWEIYRRALAVGLAGVVGALAFVGISEAIEEPDASLGRFAPPADARENESLTIPEPRVPEPLTDALRAKGYHECNPHDPVGLGPYAPYRNIRVGRIAIPQKGGHTDDMGYDVVVHFHGHTAVMKTVAQVARGVAYVGIDKGLGSGPYAKAFRVPKAFQKLRHSITVALQKHTGDERAHIRRLGLSAWSAGYGAVNEILKHGDEGIDAIILLDGLHAGWRSGRKHDQGVASLSGGFIQPTIDFARRALSGEKIFIFTHSEVDPVDYPSTERTADFLLAQLDLRREPMDPGEGPFAMTGKAEEGGFFLWSYRGGDEKAHCSHISHVAPALYLLETAWGTPAMDRSVEPTRAPKLGRGHGVAASEVDESTDAGVEPGDEASEPARPEPVLVLPDKPLPKQPAAQKVPSAAEQLGVTPAKGG